MTAQRFQVTPQRRALLNTIRLAEGTWAGGKDDGYRIMFGGGQFDASQFGKGHPDRVVRTPGYASAAAGAYQFLPTTWRETQSRRGLDPKDFSPAAQDEAALALVARRGALDLFDKEGLTPEVLHKLAPEWASLPTLAGKSYHDQPVKKRDELQKFYQAQLAAAGGATGAGAMGTSATGTSAGAAPAAAPTPAATTTAAAATATPATAGDGFNWQDQAVMKMAAQAMQTPITAVQMPFRQLQGFAQDLLGTRPQQGPAGPAPRKADPNQLFKLLGINLLG